MQGRGAEGAGAELVEPGWPSAGSTQLGLVFDGARLSKGEWQRMALARGLMRQDR